MKRYTIKDFLEIKSSTNASFSPDGKYISFLSNLSGTRQLYLIPSVGGEAKQLTFYENSVSFANFSPTKNEILFGKDTNGNELTQFYLLNIDTISIREITQKPKVKHNLGSWSRDGKSICYSSNERNGTDFDIYTMNIETSEQKCIYAGGGSCQAQSFSPKGTYLTFKKARSSVDHDIYLYNLITNKIQHITQHSNKVKYGSPRWLLDESGFYIITNLDKNFTGIALYNLKSEKFEYVMTSGMDTDGIAISFDGKCLSVTINEDGYRKLTLYELPSLNKLPQQQFPSGNINSAKFSRNSNYLALSVGDSRHTTDIWIWSIKENKYWRVTNSYQGIPPEELIEPKLIHYESFDKIHIPAFIYTPEAMNQKDRLPVIINIHGGPEDQYRPNLSPLIQYFVYSGYVVIAPNIRGSTGYGKKYTALDDIEKRMDAVKDIVELHSYLSTLPFVDPNKIVLMGGSYGGFVTLAGLTFYPKLWAAGIDIVGISNWITFLENTAPWRRSLREAEYGYLDKHRDFLISISPSNFIEKIQAPLLVIHGSNDPRVPLSEAEQIVNKLKEKNKKVEFLVYSDEGHGLSKLKNKLDAYPKVIEFLEKIFLI